MDFRPGRMMILLRGGAIIQDESGSRKIRILGKEGFGETHTGQTVLESLILPSQLKKLFCIFQCHYPSTPALYISIGAVCCRLGRDCLRPSGAGQAFRKQQELN